MEDWVHRSIQGLALKGTDMEQQFYPQTHRTKVEELATAMKEVKKQTKQHRIDLYEEVLDNLNVLIEVAPNLPTKNQLVQVRTVITALNKREI